MIGLCAYALTCGACWLLATQSFSELKASWGTLALASIGALATLCCRSEASAVGAIDGIILGFAWACAATDVATGYVFNRVSAFGGLVVASAAFVRGTELAALQGAVVAASILLAVRMLTKGRGLGLGDVKCAAVLGAGMGSQALLFVGVAYECGALWACVMLVGRRLRRSDSVAFAPFLAIAASVVLVSRSVLHG